MSPTIDIVLATYNGEKYLESLLQSILSQTYINFKIFIRDDDSSDHTLKIINTFTSQYPQQVILVPSTDRLGVVRNFSTLLNHTTNNYIMFADQDDIWLPGKISQTLAKMQEMEKHYNKNTPLLVHTDVLLADQDLQIIHPSFWDFVQFNPEKSSTLNRLLAQNVITGCTMMINRSLLKLAQPIPPETLMHDWWLGLVAAAFGHIGLVKQPTMLYRQHQSNATGKVVKFTPFPYFVDRLMGEGPPPALVNNLQGKHTEQSSYFLKRYESQLTPQQKKLLQEYSRLYSRTRLGRKWSILKNGFFQNGTARNLITFVIPPIYLRKRLKALKKIFCG